MFVAFLTLCMYVPTLLQIVTDVHLFQEKNVENVIMMFNHSGFSDNALL